MKQLGKSRQTVAKTEHAVLQVMKKESGQLHGNEVIKKIEASVCECPKCNELFNGFHFHDIRQSPQKKIVGVYVIRIKYMPPLEKINSDYEQCEHLIQNVVRFEPLQNAARLERIRKINKNECDVIYIGQAGGNKTTKKNQNTLRRRYQVLTNGHTIMYPFLFMLAFGWDLEYGCKEFKNPSDDEKALRIKYIELHKKKPALNTH